MIDICYVGNCSIDYIKTKNGFKKTIGGSAIYSSIASRTITSKNITIISNINKEIEKVLISKNINYIGNILPKINEFSINEENRTCNFLEKVEKSIEISELLEINHLHISFRKGVDIEKIITNPKIKYKKLTIDVMIHSVENFIPYIEKYIDKIDTLFCNMKEYLLLRKYIYSIPKIIITNEDKPVILIDGDSNYFFNVVPSKNIVSSTGAGDSFIGGFLGALSENNNINESINYGISISNLSLQNFGPVKRKAKIKNNQPQKLPKNIIVIGNSCAGKSTFIKIFKEKFNIYSDIDDLAPLLEMVKLDDISRSGNINDLISIKKDIKYMNDIFQQYLNNYNSIDHYSRKSLSGDGHDIIKPILWDIILKKSVEKDKSRNNIIQFSRGYDELYEKEFGHDVYNRSILAIINALKERNNLLIINITSDLNVRKIRNYIRYQNGGHFVSEDTMNKVYGYDIFAYNQLSDNRGFILINNIKIPVYTIKNNKMLSPFELKKFLTYNVNEIINYFNDLGGCKK